MPLTPAQQIFLDALAAKMAGDPASLLALVDGEDVNAATFNAAQAILAALVGKLEDGRRDLHSKVAAYVADIFSAGFVSVPFAGVVEPATFTLALAGGSAYIDGQRVLYNPTNVQFSDVHDMALVASVAGLVPHIVPYNTLPGELAVGNWIAASRAYTPVVAAIAFDKPIHFANGIVIGGPAGKADFGVTGNTTLGSTNQNVVYMNAIEAEVDTRTRATSYNGDGTVASIAEKDGTTVVKMTTFGYDANRNVTNIIEQVGGKTIVRSISYPNTDDSAPIVITKSVS